MALTHIFAFAIGTDKVEENFSGLVSQQKYYDVNRIRHAASRHPE